MYRNRSQCSHVRDLTSSSLTLVRQILVLGVQFRTKHSLRVTITFFALATLFLRRDAVTPDPPALFVSPSRFKTSNSWTRELNRPRDQTAVTPTFGSRNGSRSRTQRLCASRVSRHPQAVGVLWGAGDTSKAPKTSKQRPEKRPLRISGGRQSPRQHRPPRVRVQGIPQQQRKAGSRVGGRRRTLPEGEEARFRKGLMQTSFLHFSTVEQREKILEAFG